MKLQLSLAALERLIGGDSEIEVELRYQIVENFVNRHIKPLINSEATSKMLLALRQELEKEVKEQIAQVRASYLTTKDAENTVKSAAKSFIEETINKMIAEAIKKEIEYQVTSSQRYWTRIVNERVEAAINNEINKQVEAEIQRRLKAAQEMKP